MLEALVLVCAGKQELGFGVNTYLVKAFVRIVVVVVVLGCLFAGFVGFKTWGEEYEQLEVCLHLWVTVNPAGWGMSWTLSTRQTHSV